MNNTKQIRKFSLISLSLYHSISHSHFHRESVNSIVQSSVPAKLTKTIALPPLGSSLSSSLGHSKTGKSTDRGMRKRKSAKSTNTATSRGEGFKIKSQAAVNTILAKQQSAKSMQLTGGASDELRESRRAREAEFLKRVRKAAKEERANRLRWSVLLLYMFLVTPAQLMTPGIGRNASCALGDFHFYI